MINAIIFKLQDPPTDFNSFIESLYKSEKFDCFLASPTWITIFYKNVNCQEDAPKNIDISTVTCLNLDK